MATVLTDDVRYISHEFADHQVAVETPLGALAAPDDDPMRTPGGHNPGGKIISR